MTSIKSKRSLEFACLTLIGIPGYVWCGITHVCIDGHLYHAEMPRWWLYCDFIWAAAFLAAAVSVLRSDVQVAFIPSVLLLLLVLSRLLLQSGGGYLFIFELPIMVYLCIHSIVTIWQARRQKQRDESASHNVA